MTLLSKSNVSSSAVPLSLEEGRGEAIDIRTLPAGMYFLQMKSESGSVVKRFVKE